MFNLFILKEPDDKNFTYLEKRTPDKHRIYQTIFFENPKVDAYEEWLVKIFNQFWEKKILNVIIIFWSTKLNVVTYSPFGKPFLHYLNTDYSDYRILFRDKSLNFMGETLRIGLFYEQSRAIFNRSIVNDQIDLTSLDGVDGSLARVIIEHMNASLRIIEPNDNADIGEFLANGSATGSLKLLIEDQVDVSMNARFSRGKQFLESVETTSTVSRDDICILVQKAGLAPNIGNIFRSFHFSVWILIILAVPVFAVILKIFYNHGASSKHTHLSDLMMWTIGWNLGQPTSVLPQNSALRLLIGFWVFYCLLITGAYNGNLTSNLLLHKYLPEINTLKQLDNSGYVLVTYHRYVDLIQQVLNESDSYRNLQKNIRAVSEDDFFTRIYSMDTRYAYANKFHINVEALNNPQLSEVFNHMNECPVPFYLTYGLSYGSPFKQRINYILKQSIESGLIMMWETKRNRAKKRKAHSIRDQSQVHEKFTVYHLQSAFYILFIGLILSFFVFLCEMFSSTCKRFFNLFTEFD